MERRPLSWSICNVDQLVRSCLRNVVSMFHVLEQELAWRKTRSQLEGFDALKHSCPIVAVGAEKPLEDQLMMADYFRMLSFLTPSIYSTWLNCTFRRYRWSWRGPFQCKHLHALCSHTCLSFTRL